MTSPDAAGPGRKLSPRDLYRLRRAIATAQRAHLRAQMAQQAVRELVLELERRYALLGRDLYLDIHTGDIRNGHREVLGEPERDAHAGAAGPAR